MYKLSWKTGVYNENGEIVKTRVQISNQDSTDIITRVLNGNLTSKQEDELVHLVLEQFYNDVYPNRAENERFDKMDKVIKEANEMLDTTRKALASNGMVAFENQSELEDVQAKLEFLAKHLNVTYPSEVTDNEEATDGESTDV